jgi:DNA repair exonuclease SbcCD ATPase subunit
VSALTIDCLRLKSWKCFRGEHELRLEPKSYAVFAHQDGDRDRSNWLGKSSLLEAVDFCFYGRLVEEFRKRKVGWISRGEKSGEVSVTLSDGSRIVRSQTLSGSEKVFYFPPGSPERGATQGAAEEKIAELLGLSADDFSATRYFPQGKMSRLLTMEPGKRIDLVSGWFRLERLAGCAEDASDVLAEISSRRSAAAERARSKEEAARAAIRHAIGDHDAAADVAAALDQRIAEAAADAEAKRAAYGAGRAALERELEHAGDREAAEAYERIVEQGREVAAQIENLLGSPASPEEPLADRRALLALELSGADLELGEARQARVAVGQEVSRLAELVAGGFDGTCPVVGLACPARDFVSSKALLLGAALAAARSTLDSAVSDEGEASARQSRAAVRLSDLDARVARRGILRAEAKRLKPARDRWAASTASAPATSRQAVEDLDAARRVAEGVEANLRSARSLVGELLGEMREAREEAELHGRSLRVAAAAAAIFGPAGAQRRLAEGNLAKIEARATEMLAEAGIGLGVRVAWTREGSGVAAHCADCGEPFPRSEKVKECQRCGARRGHNIVNRLEVESTSQSGGARDLGGIFAQLATAEWLANDRGARLATALLDEPLATLDAYHRRALSARLPSILRATGVRQSIVVAHHDGFLESMPGRILIESSGGWSSARVVA